MIFKNLLQDDFSELQVISTNPHIDLTEVAEFGVLSPLEARVVLAARVSTGEGLKTPKKDLNLLKYLWVNKHTSPFEHISVYYKVTCPLFVARQWMRHRTQSYNEVSGRYSELQKRFYYPKKYLLQDSKNKQKSSSEQHEDYLELNNSLMRSCEHSWGTYKYLLDKGVSREIARMALPSNIYTEFVASVNLLNLLKFISLRNHPDAQYEIRVYAEALETFISRTMPNLYGFWRQSDIKNSTV